MVSLPEWFWSRELCFDTFGREIDFSAAQIKVFGHVSSAMFDTGQPGCIDSYPLIARKTGLNVGTVRRAVEFFEGLEVFSVESRPDSSGPARILWVRVALRDDLPELSGIDRDDPACDTPHRPAFLFIRSEEETESGSRAGARSSRAGARTSRAGATGPMFSDRAPAREVRAPARDFTPDDPATGNEQVLAQTGHSQEVAPIEVDFSLACARVGVPAPACAPANVDVSLPSPKEKTYTFAGEDTSMTDLDRRREAERFVRELRGRGYHLWPDGEMVGVHRSILTATVSPEESRRVKELKPEILNHLRELKLGPPRNVPGLPESTTPATDRPIDREVTSLAAPGEGRSSPTEKMVRDLFRSRDLDQLENATQMMIAYTRDDRAQDPNHPNHTVSKRFQTKAMRQLIMGDLPVKVMLEAMKKSMSETADSSAAVFAGHIANEGKKPKNRLAGTSSKSPGQPEQSHASMP